MSDYKPVDLSNLCNVQPDWIEEGAQIPEGHQTLRGIPFFITSADSGEPTFIGFGSGAYTESVEIPLAQCVHWVIFAHRLLDSEILEGEPVGRLVAKYGFIFSDNEAVEVPIRERFEISAVPPEWGRFAMLCVPDGQDYLPNREVGRWEETGQRQMDVRMAWPQHFVLWAWKNPYPERELNSIRIEPQEQRFIIGAITLSTYEENPFGRESLLPVVITLKEEEKAELPFSLSLEVDRGVVTFPYPLSTESLQEDEESGLTGFGKPKREVSSPAYAEIAAQPSATLKIKQEEDLIADLNWGEVLEHSGIENDVVYVKVLDGGKNWVHVKVVDEGTGELLPCRIHFQSPEGIPYQPHGHHNHLLSDMGTWHIDVGGDVRLGHTTYAYIDGSCQGWLPRGKVLVEVARGFEYEPLKREVEIKPGQRELEIKLKRWIDMNSEGWFSGDSHVHFLSTIGANLEAQCEGLNVVNLLQSQWGNLFTNTEDFIGRPMTSIDGSTIVYTSQENRQHLLGHLILLGLKSPVMPWCSDGPGEAELGGTMETTLSHWADACHEQGGTVIIPHFPNPNCEPPALIATGRADAVEMLVHNKYNHLEYYRYLNGGYRLPLVGGTDKMTASVPIGLYRTYVNIPSDEAFTYDNWCKHLRLGRTFLSGGPILRFSINGAQVGDTVSLSGKGGTVEIEASVESILPIQILEIVQEGRVVANTSEPNGARRLQLRAKVEVDHNTWFAARVGALDYYDAKPHFDEWGRGIMAHTSPIYIAVSGEWGMYSEETAHYMLTLLHGGIDYIRDRTRQFPSGTVTHHHGEEDHLAYLERPFHEAIEAIERRVKKANG
ncbi:MAG: hypothetical protein GTO18_10045 [Anaerolineales bacterium]|nr:hypothetical protein [Anaerolineales bacterium]